MSKFIIKDLLENGKAIASKEELQMAINKNVICLSKKIEVLMKNVKTSSYETLKLEKTDYQSQPILDEDYLEMITLEK